MKECPSCGFLIDETAEFCPACGSKIHNEKKETKNTNIALENDLAKAELYASDLFSRSSILASGIETGESLFLNIINTYPTESKSYIGYVNYTVRYIERTINSQEYDDLTSIYDLDALIKKCEAFLNNATKYNVNKDYEIVQEITRLKGCLESIKMNQIEFNSVNVENEKMKKRQETLVLSLICGIASLILIPLLVFFLSMVVRNIN